MDPRATLDPVSGDSEDIRRAALQLSVKERAELAADLLASLDGEPDADVEAAWAAEIERRARRVRAGDGELEDWESVRDDLRPGS